MADKPGSIASTLKVLQKKDGDDIAGKGISYPPRPRVPSGIMAFDIATGGGIPKNRMTLCFGGESSGKTLLATCLIREFQIRHPEYKCVIVEPEGTFDTDWAAACGVDVDELIISRPDHAEMASDHVSAFLQADDCGLVILDSIAAMAGSAELEKDADQVVVGGSSQVVNRLMRKSGTYLRQAERQGRPTTLFAINQPRMKAGVVFGNPETLPGGMQQHFHASLRIRLKGKQAVDPAIAKDAPALLNVDGTITKNKQACVTKKLKYTMVLVEHNGLGVGRSNDFAAFHQYASDLGLMEKVKGGWSLVNPLTGEIDEYKTQSALWDSVRADVPRLDALRASFLKELLP